MSGNNWRFRLLCFSSPGRSWELLRYRRSIDMSEHGQRKIQVYLIVAPNLFVSHSPGVFSWAHLASLFQFCKHYDGAGLPFPDHSPEVLNCVEKRALAGNVGVFLPVALNVRLITEVGQGGVSVKDKWQGLPGGTGIPEWALWPGIIPGEGK